jgi:hypothetical protein
MRIIPAVLATAVLALGVASCKNLPTDPTVNHAVMEKSMNGAAGQMPAFYDDELFTVNMKEQPDMSSESLTRNQSVNEIYTTKDLDEEQDFIPVLDAIQGDGFNPLWEQIIIVFNPGFTPHQFTGDEDIDAAAAGANPEIRLVDSHEVYRCSVVGKKTTE